MNWFQKQRVAVPVDFSPDSLEAVNIGLDCVPDPSGLYVIHVIRPYGATDPEVMETVPDRERIRKGQEKLDETFRGERYTGMHTAVSVGNPGNEIARHAEEVGAELIVMPSHGRTGFRRIALGSVAERVLRLAHCPVLVLRK
jgi:nucleotide-binding universal stress UspA family protein